MDKPQIKIVYLPRNRWRIEIPSDNAWSEDSDYTQRIIWEHNGPWGIGLVGQTAYWGEAKIWPIDNPLPLEEIDNSYNDNRTKGTSC